MSEVAGSKVVLHCENASNSELIQLTWKMNEVTLFSFRPKEPLYISEEAHNLNINVSESQVNDLVIERVQKSHTGNYTCEFNTESSGAQEQKWELMIIGELISPKIKDWMKSNPCSKRNKKNRK